MTIVKQKMPWRTFFLRAGVALVLIVGSITYFQARYTVGIDDQVIRCLDPYRLFLIDHWGGSSPAKGKIFAFHARGMEPHRADGTVVIKEIAGVPGDHIVVTPDETLINGIKVGGGVEALSEKLETSPEDLAKDFVLKDGEYFFMGWHPRSFDSRSWGVVDQSQLIGKATPLPIMKG